jgi:hypothetical protein
MSAGLPFDRFPGGFSEDGPARVDIMRAARKAAQAWVGDGAFNEWIYFGDAIWDARACGELGIPLVGIGVGGQADLLRANGAVEVLADYRQREAVRTLISSLARGEGGVRPVQ